MQRSAVACYAHFEFALQGHACSCTAWHGSIPMNHLKMKRQLPRLLSLHPGPTLSPAPTLIAAGQGPMRQCPTPS